MNKKQFKSFQWIGLILVTILLVGSFRPAAALTPRHYTELNFPPLPEVKIPDYQRYQLSNGMVVYLIEDHQLPIVSGNILIRTGERLDPSLQVGLAELVGITIRSGGTQKHLPEELNQILENRAAYIETSIDTTVGVTSFNTLSEELDEVFNLLGEIIRYPVFNSEQVELAKTQLTGEIERRNDDPNDIASREFNKLIYGANSPYARTIEYETLDNITRPDLIKFYQKYFHPDQMILGIVGDFDSEKIKDLIEKTFGDWQVSTRQEEKITIPEATQKYEKGLFLVNQPQLSQSSVLLGHGGGKLDEPDYPALDVLNGVLNGFGGRLFNQLRSRQGLAYSVYGFWNPNYDYPGTFVAGGQTRSGETVAFVKSLLAEIEKLRNTLITDKELAYAKDSILNSFVFNFRKPEQTLSRLMGYEYYGYSEDFLFQYQKAVKATTIEDVKRVAVKYLHPEKMVTLVVGHDQDIQPPLTSLGLEVKMIDITNKT